MASAKKDSVDYQYSEGEIVEITMFNTQKGIYDSGYRYVGRVIRVFENSILMRTPNHMNILVEKNNPSLRRHQDA